MSGGPLAPIPFIREEECGNCNGEGVVYWQGGPGYFSASFGNYLPSEGEDICPDCEGDGTVVVEACPICLDKVSACCCTEDDWEAYYAAYDSRPTPLKTAA